MKRQVLVLMSTYNGDRYIREQLQSIYAQKGVDADLLVRDDGSRDATCVLLDNEQSEGRLQWYTGENLGPAFSFWNLLITAPEAPYYAFADQDDVWDEDKLANAVAMLEKAGDIPALYFCQTRLVDSSLKDMKSVRITPLLTFGEALSYQFVTGCTMVINKAMRSVLQKHTPVYIRMHDVWIYDVAQAVGAKVFFDPIPHISYRQHGNNAVGQDRTFASIWRKRFQRLAKGEYIRSRLAKELLEGYSSDMSDENRKLAQMAAGYKNSFRLWMKLIFTSKLRCAPLAINFTSKIAIIFRNF
jgi:rhamnosyltransferase